MQSQIQSENNYTRKIEDLKDKNEKATEALETQIRELKENLSTAKEDMETKDGKIKSLEQEKDFLKKQEKEADLNAKNVSVLQGKL